MQIIQYNNYAKPIEEKKRNRDKKNCKNNYSQIKKDLATLPENNIEQYIFVN